MLHCSDGDAVEDDSSPIGEAVCSYGINITSWHVDFKTSIVQYAMAHSCSIGSQYTKLLQSSQVDCICVGEGQFLL